MTLRVNPEFATVLGASTATNSVWSSAFKAGLGATRRVVCKVAPAGTPQENIYSVGTKFRDAAITGEMTIQGGVVVNYGVTSDLTTSLAANLSTGVAVLRIEGNGNWVEGTLGLTGSDCDFTLPANPTTTNSIAVLPNLRIKPPPFLPSGTGFNPPALDADAPAFIQIRDFQNAAAPKVVGRIYFNRRIENWTFTDPDIAAGMGDVRVTQSTDKVVYGNTKYGYFEFGAMLLSMNSAANGSENKTLHQTIIACKPTEDNWSNYPALGGYKRGTRQMPGAMREYGISKTFPPAFKADVCRADGSIIFTHAMRDDLPINSEQLTDYPTTTKALRPKWHCAQVLMWQSHEPKLNPNWAKMFSGVDPRGIRQTMNKYKAAVSGSYVIHKYSQENGAEHWWAADKWPMPVSAAALAAKPSQDPRLYNMTPSGENAPWSTPQWAVDWMGLPVAEKGSLSYGISAMQGWGFEPGSYCLHNHYTGPGSVRIDRAAVPGPIIYHLTDPNWVHMRDNTPISEVVRHWNMGYANHGYHYFRDVTTFETLYDELGKWGFGRNYYAPNDSYVSGGVNYSIPQFAQRNGVADRETEPHRGYYTDENYSMPWNGYCIDGLHNYTTPFYTAALYSSPAHAYMFKHRFITNVILGGEGSFKDDSQYNFGLRSLAWGVMHSIHAWKLASDHPNGVGREGPFNGLVDLFNSLNRDFYIPMYVDTKPLDTRLQVMKNLGLYVSYSTASGRWGCRSFALHYYIGAVLAQMRSFGLWDLLWNHSTSVRNGMMALIKQLDTGAVAYFLQTKGRYMGSTFNGEPWLMVDNTNAVDPHVPANYAEWLETVVAPEDKTAIDLATTSTGAQRYASDAEQLKCQWVKIRKEYFGDIPCDYDLNAAVALVDGWWNTVAQRVAAGTAGDWSMMPGYAICKPPITPLF